MRRSPVALLCSLALVSTLAACANGSTHSSSGASSSATSTSAAATSAAPSAASGASGSAATPSAAGGSGAAGASGATTGKNAAEKLPPGTALPTVSGSYGDKPVLTFPKTSGPPSKIATKVLKQGTGPTVAKADLLVADYLGQIWGGKVFDNSYDRKQPSGFPIGVGQVIPGWDSTLVGLKAGSRVELSIPPAEGYGSSGQPQAGIGGQDTLVFVVDIVGSYGKSAGADPKAAPQTLPSNGPQVTGSLTAAPTLKVPAGAAKPTTPKATIVDKGTGKPVVAGTVVLQYDVVDWTNKDLASTWKTGSPQAVPVGQTGQSSPFDLLVGIPVGSRVLIDVPQSTGQAGASASPTTEPAVAVAVDIVAQAPTAKQAASQS